jgi:hypothetical protein
MALQGLEAMDVFYSQNERFVGAHGTTTFSWVINTRMPEYARLSQQDVHESCHTFKMQGVLV